MNKPRREALQSIIDKLEDLNLDIETIKDEEQEYADNMPENMQSSERHDTAENAVSSMDEAINSISEAINSIDESIG